MTDLDTRIRQAIAAVAAAEEPLSAPDDVLRRLDGQPTSARRWVGPRALSIAAVVLLVVTIGVAVLVRVVTSDRDVQPVQSGPGPTTLSTSVPPVLPSGWDDWGSPPSRGPDSTYAAMVATGTHLVLVGGVPHLSTATNPYPAVGAVLDLSTGQWQRTPDVALPVALQASPNGVQAAGMGDRAAFWWGTYLVLYDPATNQWTSATPAPRSADGPAVWTGQELLFVADGESYRPDTRRWRTLADPPAGTRWSATWDGRQVIAAGLVSEQIPGRSQAFAYDPVSDGWRRLADPPLDGQALDVTWDGHRIVGVDYSMGAATYDEATDRWTALPDLPFEAYECGASVEPMGATVLAQECGGMAVLKPDDTWLDVSDGLKGYDLTGVDQRVATLGSTSEGQGFSDDRLWTYGP